MSVVGGAIIVIGVAAFVCAFMVGWPGFAPLAILVAVIGIGIAKPRP